MLKKFLSMMLLAVGIIFCSQLATNEKVFAADVYAFSDDEIECYVWAIDYNANPKGNDIGGFGYNYNQYTNFDSFWGVTEEEADKAFIAKLKMVENGKIVSKNDDGVRFVSHDGYVFYIYLHNGDVRHYGKINSEKKMRDVYNAAIKFING